MFQDAHTLHESYAIDGAVTDALGYVTGGSGTVGGYHPAAQRMSMRNDYDGGDFIPFWQSWAEHAFLRYQARVLSTTIAMTYAVSEALDAYVIGSGFTYEFKAKRGRADKALLKFLQNDLEDLYDLNKWNDGAFESAVHQRSRMDGEDFVSLWWTPQGVEMRLINSEFITSPGGFGQDLDRCLRIERPTCWKYGVHTLTNDRTRPLGYYAEWSDSRADYTYFPANNATWAKGLRSGLMHHVKRNVPNLVKRGLTDYFPVFKPLVEDAKLLRNMVTGAAGQAAIAWIEQFSGGSKEGVSRQVSAVAAEVTNPNTGQSTYKRTLGPGSVVAMPNGKEYLPGPMGSDRNSGFEIVAALSARRIGNRWNMPEYMISADAGSTNYASALVAESPFVRARQKDQRTYAAEFREIILKAFSLRMAYEERYAGFGIHSLRDLLSRVYLHVEPPEVANRDPLVTAQAKGIMADHGVLSPDTWAKQEDLEYDVEEEQGAEEQGPLSESDVSRVAGRIQRLLWNDVLPRDAAAYP